MNRNISAQISYDNLNKGVDIRNPSTSNFLISSTDRDPYLFVINGGNNPGSIFPTNPCNFTISRANSLFNGFFTRAAVAEVDLWWNVHNISSLAGRSSFTGSEGTNTFTVTVTDIVLPDVTKNFTMPRGFYNVAECLDKMVALLNQPSPDGFGINAFELGNSTNPVTNCKTLKTTDGRKFYFSSKTVIQGVTPIPIRGLADMLSFPTFPSTPLNTSISSIYYCTNPNLQAFPYIDFTSKQLTAVQKLKDTSTAQNNPDTLFRWVFADDDIIPVLDNYGYPILQGYRPFKIRRAISMPKQIRLDPSLPIGQVNFTVVNNYGNIVNLGQYEGLEYNMLLLISEV